MAGCMRKNEDVEWGPQNKTKCVRRGKEQENMRTCSEEQGIKRTKGKTCVRAPRSIP